MIRYQILTNKALQKIAVISGSGDLPKQIIKKLHELKSDPVVISIRGFGSELYQQFSIGEIGKMLDYLRSRNVTDIVFCGAVKRPSMFSIKLDSVGRSWLKKLGIRAFLGDDALLKGIKSLLNQEGINIIKPQDILNTLLTPEGLMTECKPSDRDLRDIARGVFVLNSLSRADVGQSIVVQEGVVLTIEAIEGTAKMLERAGMFKLATHTGGVLVKMAKTQQDTALDLPTIGEQTIHQIKEANLSGIALEAKRSQIINFDKTISLANQCDVFIVGI